MQFIQSGMNMMWLALAVVSATLLLMPMLRARTGGPAVTTLEATRLINSRDALVLDVRSQDEFARGHILNARNIAASEIEARAKDIETHKNIPVIIYDGNGRDGASAAATLRKNGFSEIYNLTGGIGAWRAASLPVTK